jgi:hypothetical protein
MKKNMKIVLASILIFIGLIAGITYLFLRPGKEAYRNDCRKDLAGFNSLFVYKKQCPYCQAQFERMEEMNLTNDTYMIDAEDAACTKIMEDYSDYITYHKNSNNLLAQPGILTPTTVCLITNKTFIGEMSQEILSSFYANCTGDNI